jgi:LysM repeat protein
MALINNLYVHVTEEKVSRGLTVTEHPVETGLPITDNVKRDAITLSLTGKIVKVGDTKASAIISALYGYMQKGQYVKFTGRNIMSNAQITSFESEHTNDVNGGCSFSMDIKEVRIAKSACTGTSNKKTTSTQQTTSKKATTSKRYYTVKTGDCLWTIAKKYYGNGMQYNKIYNANKAMIDKRNKGYNVDKYTIYTGQKLLIP